MKKLKILGALTLLLALLLSLAGCEGKSTELRLGTGGVGGTYYALGSALSVRTAEEKNGLTLTAKTTAGSAANLRLLREGFLQMGIVQSDILADAVNGTGSFSGSGAYEGCAAVAGLYTEACQIVVPAASEIESVYDLAGLRVSVGEEESGVRKNAEEILKSYGLSMNRIEPAWLSFSDAADALERGEIDAFFCTAGAPTSAVSNLSSRMEIRLLSLSPEAQSNLLSLGGGYTACTIPAGTYTGQSEDVSTVGVKAVLVADTSVKKDRVEAVTRTLLEQPAQLWEEAGIAQSADLNYAAADIPCAFHAGSAEYFKEKGITVDIASGSSGKRVKAAQD